MHYRYFFEENNPDQDDATLTGNKSDLRIICEFENLPESIIIDADYPTNLLDEYLLNEQGRLEIHKVYNGALKSPKLSGVYAYANHPTTNGVDDLLQLKKNDLKKRAQELKIDLDGIDQRINTQIRRRIWESVSDLNLQSKEVPLNDQDAKKAWEQIKKHLPSFALFKSDRKSTDQDDEAQDPMKSAVKEALKEKEEELNAISEFVENEVKEIANRTVEKIREMDPNLASQLNPRFTPPNWTKVFSISLTGDEDIPINKRGSGVRRLILLNFFRAKAEQRATEKDAPGVIYAVEEPETSQHPNSQKILIQAFMELSEQPYCQVLLSTHTPMLARLLPINSLRYVSVESDNNRKIYFGSEETNRLVAKALGVLPDHDVKMFIGVEGTNDINFLKIISRILADSGEDVPNLEQLENDGSIIFIPLGGSNLALWASRLAGLNRPEFHLFDRDEMPPRVSPHQHTADEINARNGCIAKITNKMEMENYLHPLAIKAARSELDITFSEFDDVPEIVAKAVHDLSESPKPWEDLNEEKIKKKVSRAKTWLNTSAASAMTSELLNESDPNGDVLSWLHDVAQLLRDTN